MREGFIVTHIDGRAVKSKEHFLALLEGKEGGVMLEGIYDDIPGDYYYAIGL